jgi:hypothetical protein
MLQPVGRADNVVTAPGLTAGPMAVKSDPARAGIHDDLVTPRSAAE